MKKLIIGVLILLLLIGVCTLKLFVLGSPANDSTLAVSVDEGDGQLAIYIGSMDSALAISRIQYRYEGTTLHLTVWKVLSSPLYGDGNKCLYYEITDETEIWLGNKLIWSANEKEPAR